MCYIENYKIQDNGIVEGKKYWIDYEKFISRMIMQGFINCYDLRILNFR